MLAAFFVVLLAAPPTPPLSCTAPGVTPPVVTHRLDLSDIKGHHRAGIATFEVTITSRGRVDSIRVVRGMDPGVDKKLVKAISGSTFRPARYKGKPVTCTMNLLVHVEVR